MMRFHLAGLACCLGLVAVDVPALDAQSARRGGLTPAAAQPPTDVSRFDARNPDPTAGPVVAGAPFSGEATTTVTQTLGDGTRIERRLSAKLYRDSTGRVRREQTIIGLDRLSSAPPQTIITFDSMPGDPTPWVLDPSGRIATRAGRAVGWRLEGDLQVFRLDRSTLERDTSTAQPREWERAANLLTNPLRLGGAQDLASVPADVTAVEEQLGARQMEGVQLVGKRTTTLIPLGRIGNDAPIRITDERWESPELKLTVHSRFSDPRTGVVEYRLTNINRAEPRADLFAVPADYTVWAQRGTFRFAMPWAQEPQPGQRGGRGN